MIDDELMKKFDSVEDLPISEEMLGAYLEGNLDPIETFQIGSTLSEDAYLCEFVDEIVQDNIGSILDNLEHQIFDPSYPVFISDIKLPKIDNGFENLPFYEDHMVSAYCSEDLFDRINDGISDNSLSSGHLIEGNLSHEDSFLGSDQSLDVDSYESDDMFNEDSIDI